MFQTLFTSNFGAPKMVAVPIISAIALSVIFKSNVDAGVLNTRCVSSFTRPRVSVIHETGAREPEEGYDNGVDVLFNGNQNPPTIDIYSKINFDPYRLMVDSRPSTSMTTITAEISGRLGGILPEPQDAQLQFSFYPYKEDNFFWKNIIGELSQRVDDGNGGYKYALIDNYDIKNLVNSATTIPISINNGITQGDKFFPSHKLDYSFFNHADLNRDRRIDGLDFEIFKENFGRNNETDPNTFGSYVGSEPNNYNAYADINRSGTIDNNDLNIFKTYFRFPGDFNSDGRVDNTDFAYFAPDWGARDVNSISDISGPNGIPDKNVDYWDLGAFSDDYLRDINEPNTWSRVR